MLAQKVYVCELSACIDPACNIIAGGRFRWQDLDIRSYLHVYCRQCRIWCDKRVHGRRPPGKRQTIISIELKTGRGVLLHG